MRKLLTLSMLVTLISLSVFGQNKPASFVKALPAKTTNVNSKVVSRADTLVYSNFLACDTVGIFYYSFDAKKPIDSGQVEGNNFLLQTDEADYYRFGDASLHVNILGVGLQWAAVHYKSATNKFTVECLKADGPGGAPGTVLASKQLNISSLDTTFGAFNEIFFTTPVVDPGNCYMAITLPAYTNNTYNQKPSFTVFQSGFGLFSNDGGCPHDSASGTGWGKYGGTWYNYGTFWAGFGTSNGYASLSIYSITSAIATCGPITITPSAPSICNKKSVTLTASGSGVTSFTWAPSTGLNHTTGASVVAKPTVTTTYTCSGNAGACTKTVTVTLLNTPTVTLSKGACAAHAVPLTATAASGGDPLKYQWKLGSTNISGATKSTFSATASGTYSCQVTDKTTSCKTTSAGLAVTVSCRLAETEGGAFDANAYPNPFTQSLTVNITSSNNAMATVELMDFSGRTLKVYNNVDTGSPFVINENLSAGVYFVRVTQGGSNKMIKVVKN